MKLFLMSILLFVCGTAMAHNGGSLGANVAAGYAGSTSSASSESGAQVQNSGFSFQSTTNHTSGYASASAGAGPHSTSVVTSAGTTSTNKSVGFTFGNAIGGTQGDAGSSATAGAGGAFLSFHF